MIKRSYIFLILSVLFAVCLSAAVHAAETVNIKINDVPLESDSPAQIIDGRTFVPMRAIFEGLDAVIDWNADTKTVTASKPGTSIQLKIGADTMTKNGEIIPLDVPAQIIDGRAMVPVRTVSESMDCKVEWDADTKTVKITSLGVMEKTFVNEKIDIGKAGYEYLTKFAFIIKPEYYLGVFKWFLSLIGFLLGLGFALLLFFSSYDEEMMYDDFKPLNLVKIALVLSLVCTLSPTVSMLSRILGIAEPLQMPLFGEPHNLIAGVMITLFIMSFYKEVPRFSIFFGLVVYLAFPLLGHSDIRQYGLWVIVCSGIHVPVFAALCPVIAGRERFYEGWSIYFIFYMAAKLLSHFLAYTARSNPAEMIAKIGESASAFASSLFRRTLGSYILDLWIFFCILIFSFVLERWMLKKTSSVIN